MHENTDFLLENVKIWSGNGVCGQNGRVQVAGDWGRGAQNPPNRGEISEKGRGVFHSAVQ